MLHAAQNMNVLAGAVKTPDDSNIFGVPRLGGGGGSGAPSGPLRPPVGGGGGTTGPAQRPTQPAGVGAGGPGKWVEVIRPQGAEHQSKMSGQPITMRQGKPYIKEYELNGVKFDDYKDGKLYEYKGRQGKLMNKQGVFPDWAKLRGELRDQAERQVRAARGIPVIWRVAPDQVNAVKEAVGDIPGITIVP